MHRRDFVKKSFLTGGSLALAGSTAAPAAQGRGLNAGKNDPACDPWTTYNDPQWTLRRMAEAGIDRTIIFPINNTTYEEANEEIASYVVSVAEDSWDEHRTPGLV
jgi:hypothetical protein